MDDIDRALSIKLYDVMNQVGVSEKIRKLYQDTAITGEIIRTFSSQIVDFRFSHYIFGSNSEGTTLKDLNSDFDQVFCYNKWPVIDDIHTAPRGESFLMVRDNHTYPGYVKLQRVHNGTPSTIFNNEITDRYDTDTEGRICLKHVRMVEKCTIKSHCHGRHGPSDTKSGYINTRDVDHVFALRCKTIPNYAQTWLHRRRQYNWPSRANLQKMGDLGCFVVGVGHSSSREPHIEWRLSFSLQERLLMFSLNPTQHKCYVLLKIIKNDIVKAKIGESITSYHCKTCLFYALEATQTALWRPENLICCVRLCLIILLKWIEQMFCPSYFIPSENMFEKPQFRANKNRLFELLKVIIAEERSIILRLKCGDIKNRILQRGIEQNNIVGFIVYVRYVKVYRAINEFSEHIYNLAKNSLVSCLNCIKGLAESIELSKNMRVIDEHSEQQTSDAVSFVIPVLHQHIAQRMASFVCTYQDHEYARQLLYLSIHHFQLGNHDLMTSRLLVVSLLLRLKKYELCEHILEDIEHNLKRYVVSECFCNTGMGVINADLLRHLSTNNVSCKTAIRTVFVGCVRFARSDTEIAPLPLQYEMYRSIGTPPGSRDDRKDNWFDTATVDGKVYLFFLQYLVYTRLNRPANKQVAIDNLVWVIGDDPTLYHTETAYNLLGWINGQEKRILESLRCFMRSWKIRPVHNAAKWHLCIALYKYYTQ